jgi:hypothetical protein
MGGTSSGIVDQDGQSSGGVGDGVSGRFGW